MKKLVGFIGWRGMVGSVLIQEMIKNKDFSKISPVFFSTSQIGSLSPKINGICTTYLKDANDIDQLYELDIIITCQGTEYTKNIYPQLKNRNWNGYWIDAASLFRTHTDALIVLDPLNKQEILNALNSGIKKFVGGNCTVSLMLMALGGLFKRNLIEWVHTSTYQAVSGAGASYMYELLEQINFVLKKISTNYSLLDMPILELEKIIKKTVYHHDFPRKYLKVPLFGSLLPWIDVASRNGQSKEEWKGTVETNKILNSVNQIPIESTCVRVNSFRCHSQSFLIKLHSNISIQEIEFIIKNQNQWVKLVKNTPIDSINKLTPMFVSGSLNILVGRIRKLSLGNKFISIFSVGDQLLWGAAEPIRRMLNILVNEL